MKKGSEKTLVCDLCVIGGGIAGMAAAVSAAREGLKVVLIHDRTVLGGNASSEVRMWIRGASIRFPEYKEGGLVEELALDDMYYNPKMNWALWDLVLLNKVRTEKNVTLLLSSTCCGAEEEDGIIKSVTAWKTDEYVFYKVKAKLYADCSGDSVLAEFTSAQFVFGRESKTDYGEPMAHDRADDNTMGNSILLQYRPAQKGEIDDCAVVPLTDVKFESVLKRRLPSASAFVPRENFWWLELGGNRSTLRDNGQLFDELISLAATTHEYIGKKVNQSGYMLDWIGSLAAKRETRRYVGDYVLTANDILESTPFEDEIAYGGWPMDDHYSEGLYSEKPNINYGFEKPYAVPYRCIYSKNIENLLFAGRNISVTHLALSSTRVMATCAMLGHAAGFAAVVAVRHGVLARGAGEYVGEIQQLLRLHDCYLLRTERQKIIGFPDAERNLEGKDNATVLKTGESITFSVPKKFYKFARIVFDSDFLRSEIKDDPKTAELKRFPTLCYNALGTVTVKTPSSLVKDFSLIFDEDERTKIEIENNRQRLVFVPVNREIEKITFCATKTHGSKDVRLFSIDVVE